MLLKTRVNKQIMTRSIRPNYKKVFNLYFKYIVNFIGYLTAHSHIAHAQTATYMAQILLFLLLINKKVNSKII